MNRRILISCAVLLIAVIAFQAGRGLSQPNRRVQRYGMIIGVKPEMIEQYKSLHAKPWPGVVTKIRDCNIRNYSIYLKEVEHGKYYLFSYFEYVGGDFEADMAKMAEDPTTQEWWKQTDPCQKPVPIRGDKEFWASMEEVFHTD
jgi:L-rhamnose mutarotase